MPTEPIWLCIENHPTDGLRVSNLPGGPTHCYFTGTTHLPDCGYVDMDAARRVANLTQDDLLKVVGRAMYDWGPDEPNDATGYIAFSEVADVANAVWKWLGITTEDSDGDVIGADGEPKWMPGDSDDGPIVGITTEDE